MASEYMWPSFFPDSCPPTDAVPASGVVYRALLTNPPTEADYRSQAELRPHRYSGDCQATGLSVFRSLKELKRIMGMPNMKRRFKYIGEINLQPQMGKIRNTSSNNSSDHCTLWVDVEQKHTIVFNVVEE